MPGEQRTRNPAAVTEVPICGRLPVGARDPVSIPVCDARMYAWSHGGDIRLREATDQPTTDEGNRHADEEDHRQEGHD